MTVDWTRRGSQAHGQLSLFGRDNGQNFQCPPPSIAPHILFFESKRPRFFCRKQSYTAHDTTSHCSLRLLCCDTYGQNAYTAWNAYWEVLQRYPSFCWYSIDGQQVACYPTACASCFGQSCPAAGCSARHAADAGVCLAGVQGVLCANSNRGSVQPCAGKDLCPLISQLMHTAAHWVESKGRWQPFPVQTNVKSQLTGVLARVEATKAGVGETMTQWSRRNCV